MQDMHSLVSKRATGFTISCSVCWCLHRLWNSLPRLCLVDRVWEFRGQMGSPQLHWGSLEGRLHHLSIADSAPLGFMGFRYNNAVDSGCWGGRQGEDAHAHHLSGMKQVVFYPVGCHAFLKLRCRNWAASVVKVLYTWLLSVLFFATKATAVWTSWFNDCSFFQLPASVNSHYIFSSQKSHFGNWAFQI